MPKAHQIEILKSLGFTQYDAGWDGLIWRSPSIKLQLDEGAPLQWRWNSFEELIVLAEAESFRAGKMFVHQKYREAAEA